MFSNMSGMLVLALVLSGIVFLAAIAAEGRGNRMLRVMLGLEGERGKEQIFADVERSGNDLGLVSDMARLEELSRDTTEIEVAAGIAAEMKREASSAAA
ncbi:hypothetical protein [Demequina aurantiaca]|uniref:hypothetical protein n=1 Tax=Demequina aurantiaca TaxID=676200 RepID=UPI003D346F02